MGPRGVRPEAVATGGRHEPVARGRYRNRELGAADG